MAKGHWGVKLFSCWCCAVIAFTANPNQEAPGSCLRTPDASEMHLPRCFRAEMVSQLVRRNRKIFRKPHLKPLLRPYLMPEIVFSDEKLWYGWKAIKWAEQFNGGDKEWAQLTTVATYPLGSAVRSVYSRCGLVSRRKDSFCLLSIH